MAEKTHIQSSFATGEWAPNLNARVDLAKYQNAAALVRNFFVDYRGGVSTRMGTKYVLQAFKSFAPVRLIPFQASFNVGYILEFGEFYIRFFFQGAPVLETPIAITAATKANPCVISVVNTWSVGQTIYITGVGGMMQLNGKYYRIGARTAGTVSLQDLNGVNINSTGYGTYTSGGTAARVFTIDSPYAAADLALLKFAQNVNVMVLCHPNYAPRVLTLITATNWSITQITFGSSVTAPTISAINTTLAAGGVNYAYLVTAIDVNGQESNFNTPATLLAVQDLRTTSGSNEIVWGAITGAHGYNVYKTELSYIGAPPTGAQFGFIGSSTGTRLIDSNISPDYSQSPPVAQNPFGGSGVQSISLTASGTYTSQPSVAIAPPGAGVTATAALTFQAVTCSLAFPGSGYTMGDTITLTNGITLVVNGVFPSPGPGVLTSFIIFSLGGQTVSFPPSPVLQVSTSGGGSGAQFNLTWGVATITLTNPGSGYGAPPAVTFTPAGATAVTTIGAGPIGNPSVPGYFQQRLVLGAPSTAPPTFLMSQTGNYYNLDVHDPLVASDAITGTLVSGQLNEIKSMISMPSGLMILTNWAAWLINGGSPGSAVAPFAIVANANAYNGANDVPPIVASYDILYVQSKGSIVRNLSYNFYSNVFAGTDISVYSSHLFFGYQLLEWAWCQEPFKIAWVVRNDGNLLSLTFLKEQELIGWTHNDTNGYFKSVATVTEQVAQGSVDALYTVVQRTVNGNTVQYIERMADRFLSAYANAWCVDAGIQYVGAATTAFTGAEHLAGLTVTGLADGVVIPAFTMPTNGNFTLSSAASTVIIGLAFTPQLQTLPIEIGNPTIQGKRKAIPSVTVRVADTLGLSIGANSSTLVPMKDLVLGNLGSQTNEVVTGLVTGDAMTNINAQWTPQGQYFIEQSQPYPATILGVIPDFTVGDTNSDSRRGQ